MDSDGDMNSISSGTEESFDEETGTRKKLLRKKHAKLRGYVAELMRVDSQGRFELKLQSGGIFEALYI